MRSLLILFSVLSLNLSLNAQSWVYKNEFGFKSDNDSYLALGQDRYYTNGLFITFRHATDQRKINHQKLNKFVWELEAGQSIYNAQTGNVSDISFVDRPYAAYLYGGVGLYWLYNSENTFKFTLQAGTIGPSAKGKEAQEFMHKTFGFYDVDGWQFQVNNATGINTRLEFTNFLRRTENAKADFAAAYYVNLGTTFTGAGAGAIVRTGTLSQYFHSATSNSRVGNEYVAKPLNPREFFFFAKPMVNFVAYDATIQGGMGSEDKGPVIFDPKRMVYTGELGVVFAVNRWTADYTLTFKTKELKSVAKRHQYGSVRVFYRFN